MLRYTEEKSTVFHCGQMSGSVKCTGDIWVFNSLGWQRWRERHMPEIQWLDKAGWQHNTPLNVWTSLTNNYYGTWAGSLYALYSMPATFLWSLLTWVNCMYQITNTCSSSANIDSHLQMTSSDTSSALQIKVAWLRFSWLQEGVSSYHHPDMSKNTDFSNQQMM